MKNGIGDLRSLIREVLMEFSAQGFLKGASDFVGTPELDLSDGDKNKSKSKGLATLTDPGAKHSKMSQLGNALGVKNMPKTMTKLLSVDDSNQLSTNVAKDAANILKNFFTVDPKTKAMPLKNIVGKTQSKQNLEDKKKSEESEEKIKQLAADQKNATPKSGATPSSGTSEPG